MEDLTGKILAYLFVAGMLILFVSAIVYCVIKVEVANSNMIARSEEQALVLALETLSKNVQENSQESKKLNESIGVIYRDMYGLETDIATLDVRVSNLEEKSERENGTINE
jgi:septal ring factor EnvC (AmiA/AmiB activator)